MQNQLIESNLYELLSFVRGCSGLQYINDGVSGFVGVSHSSSAWPYMTVNVKDGVSESDIAVLPELIKKGFPTLAILGDDASRLEDSMKQVALRKVSVWANMYIDSKANINVPSHIEVREINSGELEEWKELVEDVLFQKKKLDAALFTTGVNAKKFKLLGAYTNENKLVGTLMIFFGSVPGVYMVATHDDFRKQGVASGLVSAAVKYVNVSGCPYLVLHSTAVGLPFYQKIGFNITGNLSLYYYMNK